jgi:hypothetical protein
VHVPDIGLTKLTTAVGRHFNCFPADLATKASLALELQARGSRATDGRQ